MENVYRVFKLGCVNDPVLASLLYADFSRARPNLAHGLPILWVEPSLDPIQLVSAVPFHRCRELANHVQ